MNDLWTSGTIKRTQAGDGHATLYGCRLAVHLMVQSGVAQVFMADTLRLRQGKTDKPLVLPCTKQLKAALEQARQRLGATPIVARPILIQPNGNPMTCFYMAHAMRAGRARLGVAACDLHALRYRSIKELAWAGCTDDQIAAYSGHATLAMIAKYAGEARQEMRARQARDKRQ